MVTTRNASTSQLQPGEDSISRVTPRKVEGGFLLDWTIKLDDGKVLRKRSQARTVGQVRAKAYEKAEELRITQGSRGAWKPSSPLSEFILSEATAQLDKTTMADATRRRYDIVVKLLAGQCDKHEHAGSLKGHSIKTGTRFDALERALLDIAGTHGVETARQARTVLGKYVMLPLVRKNLIERNPLRGESIDLASAVAPTAKRSEETEALTRDEYVRVLDHLLALDPAEGVKPGRGRWSLEDRIALRRNMIDLTLLQAVTGLRVSEANALTWEDVLVDDDGYMNIVVGAQVSKTKMARTLLVLDDRVAERLVARRDRFDGEGYVIGAPSDHTKLWDRDNCRKGAATFYKEIGQALKIPLFETHRTHLWRATINSLVLDLPANVRAGFLGHSEQINAAHYTAKRELLERNRLANRQVAQKLVQVRLAGTP